MKSLIQNFARLICGLMAMSIWAPVNALDIAQSPLFVGASARPVVMLAMSRDHELFYKAYPDYSNLDGGPLRAKDLTYRNDFEYAGYFDSEWCYSYNENLTTLSNSVFVPEKKAVDPLTGVVNHQCDDLDPANKARWSGNFLNWASMTRIDILRKVLFGGKRSVDTAATSTVVAETVLERTYIPKDSHAFVKVYQGQDGAVSKYTPYTDTSISLCNVSTASDSTGYPVIRVASGPWVNWSHSEIQQCQWRSAPSSPTNLSSTITTSPTLSAKKGELIAKVKVCVPGKDAEGNLYNPDTAETKRCNSYQANSYKPIGVLQKKYKDINFGLVTGTWTKPGQGGVLRKKAGRIAGNLFSGTDNVNEFSETTGVFNANVTGIIGNINLFRINQFTYTATSGNTNYSGNASWRNPIGEIYAEALRYFAGKKSAYSLFDTDDSGSITGLSRVLSAGWDDPIPSVSWCSKCSIVILSSGPNSFDTDGLDNTLLTTINSSLTSAALNTRIDNIGNNEFGAVTNKFFMGHITGSSLSTQCQIGDHKLSALRGFCPESATTQGGYGVAGLANFAKTNDLRSGYTGSQTVSTFAVELSEGLPTFDIPIPAATSANKKVSIVPVCTNGNHSNACSLVGVRVENIVNDGAGNPISGRYLFYWEDSDMIAYWIDFDMDAVQRLEFCVGAACTPAIASDRIKITNTLPYWATGASRMHMSYQIEGTTTSGLQANQWVTRAGGSLHNFGFPSSLGLDTWYNAMDGGDPLPNNTGTNAQNTSANNSRDFYRMTATYTKSTTSLADSLTNLQTPLFYAAKYGGFTDIDGNGMPNLAAEWDVTNSAGATISDGIPDNYFVMKNPSLLEAALNKIFNEATRDFASGSGVATNSSRLDTVENVYQALFYPPQKDNNNGLKSSWHGEIRALRFTKTVADFAQNWSTMGKLTSSTGRKIYSYNPDTDDGFEFANSDWNELSASQKTALGGDTVGKEIQNWVRGDDVDLSKYRARVTSLGVKNLLGDIVNSSPVFAGSDSQGFENLGAAYGSANYLDYLENVKSSRPDLIYVGANDGMLHGFRTDCVATPTCGTEVLAYVPSAIYSKLPVIASPAYGAGTAHTYLVDGALYTGDAYIKTKNDTDTKWRNILVGALGGGARGIFVLDVTDPENFDEKDVLFEITAADYPQIGNVMSKIYIAPVNGRWSVIFGNGYNSTDNRAYLMVIDLEEPFNSSYSGAIPTNASPNNGLAGPALYRASTSVPYQYAYAGDYLGNMWKFDISNGYSATLNPAYNAPLFSAGSTQPITAAPTLGFKSGTSAGGADAIMVYFGTGSYITAADAISTPVNSFYGIADSGSPVTGTKSTVLHEKKMTTAGNYRDVDDMGETGVNPVDWSTKQGWYLDFPAAERVITRANYLYDRLLFSTMIPNSDTCTFGGSGWLMQLVGVGDKYADSYSVLVNPDPETSGEKLDFYIPGELVIISDKKVVGCNIEGGCFERELKGAEKKEGRISWRQIK